LIKFIHTPLKHPSLRQSNIIFINQAPYTPPKKLTIHHLPPIQDPSQVISTQENLANQLAMLSVKRADVFQDHQPTTNQPKYQKRRNFLFFFQKKTRFGLVFGKFSGLGRSAHLPRL